MNIEDLERIADRATDSTFRLEALPQYLVPQEDADFAAWKRGLWRLPTPDNDEWLAHVKNRVDAGHHWYRVHILDQPLSDYTLFELYGYQANAAAGEDIYLADRGSHPDLVDLHTDFWLFDSETAVVMHYDDDGHFLHPELVDDARPYVGMRATALRHAVPLDGYLRQNTPRLIA